MRRAVFFGLVALIFLYAAWQRFHLPQTPFSDEDTWGYLYPPVVKLTGGSFAHAMGRQFVYPAFLFVVLCAFGDFRAVGVTQHLLGLLAGVLLLLAWRQLTALLLAASRASAPTLFRPVPRAAGNLPEATPSSIPGADTRESPLPAPSLAEPHVPRSSAPEPGLLAPAPRSRVASALASVWPGFFAVLGLVLLFAFLCSENTVLYEHTLRPEAIFPCFGALSLYLNLRFIRLRWLDAQPRAAWPFGAAAVFVSCLLLLLRPAFALALPLVNLPVLLAVWQNLRSAAPSADGFSPWRTSLGLLGLPLALATVLLFVPERWLASRDPRAASLMAEARFAVHANLIRDQLRADLASGAPVPFPRAELQAVADRLDHCLAGAQQKPGRPPFALGFNADYLLAAEPVFLPPWFDRNTPEGEHRLARFANVYYVRTVLHHPLAMARKVLVQLGWFYHWNMFRHTPRGLYEPAVRLADKPWYPHSLRCFVRPDLQERIDRFDAARDYQDRTTRLRRTPAQLTQPLAVIWLNQAAARLYLPVLGLTLLCAGASGWISRRAGVSLRLPALVVGLLYTYNFGISLTVATVQTLGTGRYVEFQRIFTLFATAAGLGFCVLVAAAEITGADKSSWKRLLRRSRVTR